jgi:hypothetical protein
MSKYYDALARQKRRLAEIDKLERGLCRKAGCEFSVEPGKTMCGICLHYLSVKIRHRYDERKRQGLCVHCGAVIKCEDATVACRKCRPRKFNKNERALRQQRNKVPIGQRLRIPLPFTFRGPLHEYIITERVLYHRGVRELARILNCSAENVLQWSYPVKGVLIYRGKRVNACEVGPAYKTRQRKASSEGKHICRTKVATEARRSLLDC